MMAVIVRCHGIILSMQPNNIGRSMIWLIQTLTEKSVAIQNMRGQGYFRAAKDDYGSKYISLLFYFCPDTCVSLVLLLA